MENSYKEMWNQDKVVYDRLLAEYMAVSDTDIYRKTVLEAPFALLKMIYLAKRIQWYHIVPEGKKPHFSFVSVSDALATYTDIVQFKDRSAEALETATILMRKDNLAEAINAHIAQSVYLTPDLMVGRDTIPASLARECLKLLPETEKCLTEELRLDVLRDILNSFSEKQIVSLAAKGFFEKKDVEALLAHTLSNTAKRNICHLCHGFHIPAVSSKSTVLNLKGVTFKNEDGSDRQEILKELDDYIRISQEYPALKIQPYIYQPEIGASEHAARVLWGSKCLGNLPRDVAAQIHEKYSDKTLRAKVINVVGGAELPYGVKIKLDICEPVITVNVEPTAEECEKDLA